jgi:uncharacterized small protein (DUF1192 family)
MAYDELTAKLVSENATLRAEVERLTAEMQIRVEAGKRMVERRDADIERLRAALEKLATGYHGGVIAQQIAAAALAQEKPND